ncbi:hypothetical protein [Absidia glauca]|uniref:Uncharacterized protein n=1 Tax=Absidia glauca TaxID=4829 RepID=A0A163KCD4_ABSGL|nr:hypothetical protein [Absidia glauca]
MEQQHAYQLTENLLLRSTTPLSHQSSHGSRSELLTNKRASSPMMNSTTPPPLPLVSPLPDNAVVFKSPNSTNEVSDASFHQYIDRQFQQDAPILKTQLDSNSRGGGPSTADYGNDEPNTLWDAIKTDLVRVKETTSTGAHRADEQQHQDYHETDEPRPWWTWDHIDGMYSIGALLFVFGFLFPPLWWIGAFWPRRPEQGGKMAKRWQQLNRYLSIGFSIILVIVIIVVGALYGSSHQQT